MSEPFMALALGKQDAIADWRKLIGPTHVYKAQWEKPETLRARFGISGRSSLGQTSIHPRPDQMQKTREMHFMDRTAR
jgi:nucleoside diphosphate kinase